MKSVAEHLESAQSEHTPTNNQANGRSSRIHYILVAVLAVAAYLISSWVFAGQSTISLHLASNILFLWLGGGVITLALLTFAAKR